MLSFFLDQMIHSWDVFRASHLKMPSKADEHDVLHMGNNMQIYVDQEEKTAICIC